MIRFIRGFTLPFLIVLLCAKMGMASSDRYVFNDPKQEMIFNTTIQELRCLVCQNETLADSQAPLAEDLRSEIAKRVQRGESKTELLAFMKARYGDFVLYRPSFDVRTFVLWMGPLCTLIVGVWALLRMIRSQEDLLK